MFSSINVYFCLKRVDVVTIGLVPSSDKMRYMEFAPPSMVMPYQFLLPVPDEESRLLGPIRPFQPTVSVPLVHNFFFSVGDMLSYVMCEIQSDTLGFCGVTIF